MGWVALTEEEKIRFEDYLIKRLKANMDKENLTDQAMVYAVENGGKRMRPMLLLATIASFSGQIDKGYPTAAALELIHSYSLIHDDLPAMDDDALRRGKPATHIAFGEAVAILAGDGLLTKAFELITEGDIASALKLELSKLLAVQAGHAGMVAGQSKDLAAEQEAISLEELAFLHRQKTGALIAFAVVAGAKIAEASEQQIATLEQFAYSFGLAYQIRDDILDITADEETLGKPVASDEKSDKSTYPALLGLAGAYEALDKSLTEAERLLDEVAVLAQDKGKSFDGDMLKRAVKFLELASND